MQAIAFIAARTGIQLNSLLTAGCCREKCFARSILRESAAAQKEALKVK